MSRSSAKNSDIAIHSAHTFLSDLHITPAAFRLQIHTYMLAICAGGIQKTWNIQGILSLSQTDSPLSPLGRAWIRSRPINFVVFRKNNDFTAYNNKNNNSDNNSNNKTSEFKSDLCLRLRILFVSFFGSDF